MIHVRVDGDGGVEAEELRPALLNLEEGELELHGVRHGELLRRVREEEIEADLLVVELL